MKDQTSYYIIRDVETSDAKELIHYMKQVSAETDFLSFGPDEFDLSVGAEKKFIKKHLEAENMLMIVAASNGKIVGNLNVHSTHKRRLRHVGEFGITVIKSHWGQGIGKAMLLHMITWAKENAIIKKISLTVNENNVSAIHLYEKLGFEKEGVLSKDFYIHGGYQNSILMGMLID